MGKMAWELQCGMGKLTRPCRAGSARESYRHAGGRRRSGEQLRRAIAAIVAHYPTGIVWGKQEGDWRTSMKWNGRECWSVGVVRLERAERCVLACARTPGKEEKRGKGLGKRGALVGWRERARGSRGHSPGAQTRDAA